MLPGIDLLQLFVAVADSGSIASAARELDLSPSTASRKIATLEREFGTQLLLRTTRSLRLTEGGVAFLGWARATVEGYQRVDDTLGALQNSPTGMIRIACNDYAAVNYLPLLLKTFSARHPKLQFSVSTTPRPEQLLEASCDLLLHIGPRPEVDVVARKILDYTRCLCASPEYLAQYGTPQSIEDLAGHRCLTHSGGEAREWSFLREGRVVRQPIEPHVEVDSYTALFRLSAAGLGIARLSELALRDAFASGQLVKVLPDHIGVFADGEIAGMWLLFPERKVLHRTRLLADFLAREIRRVVDTPGW